MSSSSDNSSFIPKQGGSLRKRSIHKDGRYILTRISYLLLFAALVASGAVFVYSLLIQDQLQTESIAMSEATGQFKEADMLRVQEFDVRLRQANHRLAHSASINSILEAFEAATIDTIAFSSFNLERDFDSHFIVDAEITTDTFDSTIFQRDLYTDSETIGAIEINDLSLSSSFNEETGQSSEELSLSARVFVPLEAVLRSSDRVQPTVTSVSTPTIPVDESAPSDVTATEIISNEIDL